METPTPTAQPITTAATTNDSIVQSKIEELAMKWQEKELLDAFPDAKHVVAEVKALAKANGVELKSFYEKSPLKAMAEAATVAEKAKQTPSSATTPSGRQGPDLSQMTDLVNKVKGIDGQETDRIALVSKALNL
jgi:hypothetical protein